MQLIQRKLLFYLTALLLTACGGSNNGGSAALNLPPADPPPATMTITTTLTGAEVIGGGDMSASASAELVLNLDDGGVSGRATFLGIEPTAVALKEGFAGERGETDLFVLTTVDGSTFELPAGAVLSAESRNRLEAGGLHFGAVSDAFPDGALRGQLLQEGQALLRVPLSGTQEIPIAETMGSGTAFVTLNRAENSLVLHLSVAGLPDTIGAHIHQALAGANGGILVDLVQDSEDQAHWSVEDLALDVAGRDSLFEALDEGRLYVNVHTLNSPPGEIRGQIEPAGIEVLLTLMTGMDIVPVSTETAATRAMALAAITIDELTHSLSIHVNTVGLEDATAARLHQAPANRNGPELVALTRNADNPAHWSLDDWPLTAGQYLALRNQGLYLTVETAAFPGGQVRGQLIPADSMPGGTESFRVLNVTPAQGAEVASLPASITVTLNRDVLVDSVGPGNVLLTRSGGDGDFGSNDEAVDPMANTVTGNLIELDLTGIVVPDDLFQLSIADITDEDGVLLDGDGDGAPGGLFTHTFSVMASAPAAPTLTELQNTIFTPTCTNIGCHSGPAPAVGLNLTAGQTFANLVGIPSAEQAGLSRVDPGSPDTSYLVHKIEGRASIAGSRMPLGGPMLPMQQLQSIRDWISAGAGDN